MLLRNAGHWFTTSHSPESLVDSIDDRSAGSLLELLVSCCRPALLPSLSCFALCCVKKYSFQEFKNTLDTLFIEQRSLQTQSHSTFHLCIRLDVLDDELSWGDQCLLCLMKPRFKICKLQIATPTSIVVQYVQKSVYNIGTDLMIYYGSRHGKKVRFSFWLISKCSPSESWACERCYVELSMWEMLGALQR